MIRANAVFVFVYSVVYVALAATNRGILGRRTRGVHARAQPRVNMGISGQQYHLVASG